MDSNEYRFDMWKNNKIEFSYGFESMLMHLKCIQEIIEKISEIHNNKNLNYEISKVEDEIKIVKKKLNSIKKE